LNLPVFQLMQLDFFPSAVMRSRGPL